MLVTSSCDGAHCAFGVGLVWHLRYRKAPVRLAGMRIELCYDRGIEPVAMCDGRHVASTRDGDQLCFGNDMRKPVANAPRRYGRGCPAQEQGWHRHETEVVQPSRLVERGMEFERDLGEPCGHGETLIVGNFRPRV